MSLVLETKLSHLAHRGKVRDMYDLGDHLLMVATDRLSAFDVVLSTGIPSKGAILAKLSAFWFERTSHIAPNHFEALIEEPAQLERFGFPCPPELLGRSTLVRKAQRIDVECVARGYLTGSAWADYRQTGRVFDHKVPSGLIEADRLPEPLFTPTTKVESGHDEPISEAQLRDFVGVEMAQRLRDLALSLYVWARDFALPRGIIVADTKFEFGLFDGQLIVIDEMLTPDSSRFWATEEYKPGSSPPSFDKQYVRDWLTANGWDHEPPAPELPPEVVDRTTEKYREAYRRITGKRWTNESA
jgi:phosphoribosylaminoimidazole-succinocarboxamide synthase